VTIVLLPLYFTYSGLNTHLETLNTYQAGVMVVLVIAVANIGKIGGATLASLLTCHTFQYATLSTIISPSFAFFAL